MIHNPLISIIVPIYNSCQYVEECVNSVLNESISNIEILLLDDGSTDHSEEICTSLAGNNEKIKYFKLPHQGVSATRNYGLDQALGKYIFFLDSDDRIEKGLLDSLFNKMEAHNAIMGNSILRKFGRSCSTQFSLNSNLYEILSDDETLNEFIDGVKSLMAIGGKMMRRDRIGESRFRTDLPSGEDTFFIYDYLKKGGKTVFEYNYFYEYRIHKNNVTGLPSETHLQSIITVKNYLLEQERQRVGEKQAIKIWLDYEKLLRKWMDRCSEYKENKQLREKIISFTKELKRNPLYSRFGKRTKLRIFTFTHFPQVYKLVFAEKVHDFSGCSGCGACKDACSVGAISMKFEKDGFVYPQKDHSKCNNCGQCFEICPYQHDYDIKAPNEYYAFQATNNEIREKSTSGGAFRLLAEAILDRDGIVVGATMDDSLTVKHIIVDSREGLLSLLGSKYVQSDTDGIYLSVKKNLDLGKKVLFCGTPCQAEALRRYLKKEYPNLYLIDLICNGVASPILWKRYTKYLERKYQSKLLSYSFRDKRNHDSGHTVSARFQSGEKTWSMYNDKFCLSYFRGVSLRRQCTNCLYSTDQRASDITIGDFWGIENYYPEMDDGMGTSLLIVHSSKGQQLYDEIKDKAKTFKIKKEEARQPRLYYSAAINKNAKLAAAFSTFLPLKIWFKIFIK